MVGIKSEILSVLRESEPLTVAQIAVAIGRPKSTWLRNKLEEMHLSGMITRSTAKTGGRPAHVYGWKNPQKLTPRQQWRRWCEEHFAIDYVVWLEGRVTGEIDRD